MGMESFNELPEETQLPDESQRIEDQSKAQQVAFAEKGNRDEAALYRSEIDKLMSGETPIRIEGGNKVVEVAQQIYTYETSKSDDEIKSEISNKLKFYAENTDARADRFGNMEQYDIENRQ